MGRLHLRVYSETPKVELAGVADLDRSALQNVKESYEIPVYTELSDLLDQNLDAVSVCVPTSLHFEVGMAVMQRDVALIIEKPLASTAAEGEALVAEAEKRGLPLMVGHIERFNPAVQRVKSLIQEDEAISIQIERVGPYPPRIQDVGVIKDLGSHDIDLIRYLSGAEFKRVFAVTSTTIGKHEDTAIISAEMENGVLGQITTNWVTPYKSRNIRVATKNGYIEANLITQQVKQYSKFTTYDASYNVREWPLVYREPV
jgi:predicted dehydrogenase